MIEIRFDFFQFKQKEWTLNVINMLNQNNFWISITNTTYCELLISVLKFNFFQSSTHKIKKLIVGKKSNFQLICVQIPLKNLSILFLSNFSSIQFSSTHTSSPSISFFRSDALEIQSIYIESIFLWHLWHSCHRREK
jgi:hypothetical protein